MLSPGMYNPQLGDKSEHILVANASVTVCVNSN